MSAFTALLLAALIEGRPIPPPPPIVGECTEFSRKVTKLRQERGLPLPKCIKEGEW